MKKYFFATILSLLVLDLYAQDIPEHISYTQIYDFLDELANDGVIELNTTVKPYSRMLIAEKLQDASSKKTQLNSRQRADLVFFTQSYMLETNKLPETLFELYQNDKFELSLVQPALYYRDTLFRAKISPILGMNIVNNSEQTITKRWVGAELHTMIGKHISVWGSLRDISFGGGTEQSASLLARPQYLNNQPGAEYKESSAGNGDFSDSRGGVMYSAKWGSVGFVKDNFMWGDNYHGSNILSGRAPSFPMVTLKIKP
ncbi:MAG: hypothetical protein LBV31_02345, partial [Prevotellaceae bacterium]|nr:hypothetical protein [Prevotellaceae bacterium]